MRFAVLALVIGCGGSSSAPPAVVHAPSIVAPADGTDDAIVATVNGRPVWGSCVAAQRKPVAQGVQDCIAFELLAQAAEARGLATEPGVVDATRTALVSRVVAQEFEDKIKTPADLGGVYDQLIDAELAKHAHRPEFRRSAYVRAAVPPGAPPEVEAKAKATMGEIAAALRDQAGLYRWHVDEIADPIAKANGITLEREDVSVYFRPKLEKPYGDALFAIPEVGRTSGPVRTSHGWDVILWTEGLPARDLTRDELVEEMFPELRRKYFVLWVARLAQQLGITVEENPAQLEDS